MPSRSLNEKTLRHVHARLRQKYGARPWKCEREPILDCLIGTILSQNTTDKNSSRAWVNLKREFADWDAVRSASPEKIESAIRCGGLAKTKAARIQKILQSVFELRVETSLEYLRRATTQKIKEELSRFPGVGPKTIACVLMFNLKRPDFPVDTHIHRIAQRLGWMRDDASAEETYELMNEIVPEKLTYEFHVLLIQHGRQTCKAQTPRCLDCPLWLICEYAHELRQAMKGGMAIEEFHRRRCR